jgi:mRNA interferase MazF
MTAIQITIDEALLKQLDADAEVRQLGDRGRLSASVRAWKHPRSRWLVRRGRMARQIARGQIWMYEFRRPDKRRPVLILSRDDAIGVLHTVMVAPVTSTILGLPSEVVVGVAEGLKHDSAANLDHVQTVEQGKLGRYLGHLDTTRMSEVCRALAIAAGCGPVS